MTEGSLTATNGGAGSFLGVYTDDAGTGPVLNLPATGLAFFRRHSADRHQSHAGGLLGPESQSRQVRGVHHGAVRLRFEAPDGATGRARSRLVTAREGQTALRRNAPVEAAGGRSRPGSRRGGPSKPDLGRRVSKEHAAGARRFGRRQTGGWESARIRRRIPPAGRPHQPFGKDVRGAPPTAVAHFSTRRLPAA